MASATETALIATERDLKRTQGKLARLAQESKNALKHGVNTGLTVGTSFTTSYVMARYPERSKIAGVDMPLLVGGLAWAAGALGWLGSTNGEYMLAIGNGALASHAAHRGTAMGEEAKNKAK